MTEKLVKFFKDEDGLTMVEYAIAGGLVGAGAIIAFSNLGTEVARVINDIYNALTTVTINTGP
jgi:pilus assembly protein Flp/PilA